VLFVIHGTDKPDHAAVRAEARQRHLVYVCWFADHVVVGGPTVDESDHEMTGSLLIVDFPDLAAAQAFADGDPYRQVALFGSVTVTRWRQSLGAPLAP
jgi:uncharacterized protein YciI